MDTQYQNLHVRNSWNIENHREEPNVLSLDGEESVRSFDASQYSDGHSFSSDDNLFQLPDLEKNLLVRSSSPGPPVTRNDSVPNDLDQHEEDNCKEVRCIELEDLSANTHKQSNPEDSRSNAYTNSNASSPRESTSISGLIVADSNNNNRDREKVALSSSGSKEDKRVNHLPQDFVLSSPKEISVCMTGNSRSGTSRAVKLSRSRSCKASLMRNFSSDWFEDEDDVQNTPPIGNEKHFPGRPNGFPKNIYALNYNARPEGLSWNGHGNFEQNSAADIVQNVKSSTNKESKYNSPLPPEGKETENLKRLNLLADHEVASIIRFMFHDGQISVNRSKPIDNYFDHCSVVTLFIPFTV